LTRVLLIVTGAIALIGLVYTLLSLFAVTNVGNDVSRHVIARGRVIRGLILIFAALVLFVIALSVRPA
jgi:hypothetical protein